MVYTQGLHGSWMVEHPPLQSSGFAMPVAFDCHTPFPSFHAEPLRRRGNHWSCHRLAEHSSKFSRCRPHSSHPPLPLSQLPLTCPRCRIPPRHQSSQALAYQHQLQLTQPTVRNCCCTRSHCGRITCCCCHYKTASARRNRLHCPLLLLLLCMHVAPHCCCCGVADCQCCWCLVVQLEGEAVGFL